MQLPPLLRTHPTAHNSTFLFCSGFLPPACLHPGRNGEEAIPMLMLNHSDKPDGARPPRPQPQSSLDRSPPRLVEISSNPGSPKLTELKAAGKYAPSLTACRSTLLVSPSSLSSPGFLVACQYISGCCHSHRALFPLFLAVGFPYTYPASVCFHSSLVVFPAGTSVSAAIVTVQKVLLL